MSTQVLPKNPREVRELIRGDQWHGVTSGVAPGYVQANLAILPRDLAFDFLLFCQRNPKPCPLLEVIDPGQVEPALTAPGADIRTDIASYRIYERGEFVGEVDSLLAYWRASTFFNPERDGAVAREIEAHFEHADEFVVEKHVMAAIGKRAVS